MSLIIPMPRNAVDRHLPQWSGGQWYPFWPNCSNCIEKNCVTDPNQPHWNPQKPSGCTPPGTDGWGCNCANTTSECNSGQSCFWFRFLPCPASARPTCTGEPANPNTKDLCGSGMKATLCDSNLRTFNRDAPCNSEQDLYRHNPWRAPGSAPVFDSCGMAGGGPHAGGGESKITETIYTKQGDLGSKTLPVSPTGVVWKAGSNVTTGWSVRANHGGGYQYRLCPLGEDLNEACFMKIPLPFATSAGQTLFWSNSTSRDIKDQHSFHISGTYVSEGTLPKGSTWAMNPLPYSNAQDAPSFPPPCNETVDRKLTDTPSCSGRDPFNTLIVDTVLVPASLAPGKYVLGIRWDCEKSGMISVILPAVLLFSASNPLMPFARVCLPPYRSSNLDKLCRH
eukprot:gene4565-829_t